MSAGYETVPTLPLSRRRRLLRIMTPLLNLPLFIIVIYQVYESSASGTPLNLIEFLSVISVLGSALGLGLLLSRWAPVYESKIGISREGVVITRPLRGSILVPYRLIQKVEVYLRRQHQGTIPREALLYARSSVEALRRKGLKFSDYTNSEEIIALLITEKRVYMLSPVDPKSLVRTIRRRVPSLLAQLVELTPKGKRTRNL